MKKTNETTKQIFSDQYGSFEVIRHKNHASTPTVSVIMSVYNGRNYLEEAIESILTQTFSDFEFIIVNDGSTDKSLDMIFVFFENDPRIVIVNQQNIGLTKSLNRGINIAKGKFIARQDADDKSYQDRISSQVEFLKVNPDYFMVGTAYDVFDEEKGSFDVPDVSLITGHTNLLYAICKFNPFFHSSVLFRNDLSKLNYFYDTRFKYAQDYEFWLRVVKYYKVENLVKKLCLRRLSSEAIGRKKRRYQRRCVVKLKLNLIKRHFFNIGFWYYFMKDFVVAFRGL